MLLLVSPAAVFAQSKTKKPVKKPVKKPAATAGSTPASSTTNPSSAEPLPPKKNERLGDTASPTTTTGTPEPKKTNRPQDGKNTKTPQKPVYPFYYQFDQPAFFINQMKIQHDDNGKGEITFSKRDFAETYTDPLQLSPLTVEKLKGHWNALNFLDSTETYQTSKDYSHLGVVKLSQKRDARERLVELNWSDNKDTKALMDTYRNVGQIYVWMFDINLSRENQPLEAPKLMEAIDGMLRRNEVPDPQHLLPLLKDLSEDERIPLLARNHAAKIVKQIEKEKK